MTTKYRRQRIESGLYRIDMHPGCLWIERRRIPHQPSRHRWYVMANYVDAKPVGSFPTLHEAYQAALHGAFRYFYDAP